MSAPQNKVARPKRRLAIASAVAMSFSLGLWLWTSGIYYRPLPRLGLAARALGLDTSIIASDDGVHFRFSKASGRNVEFRWRHFNRPNYHHGLVLSALGVVVAAQPYTYNGGDYIISPNAGVAAPYWLLIGISGYGLLRFSGLSALRASYCRFGITAWIAMIAVGLAFVGLNAIPEASRPGAQIQPQNLDEWWRLIFEPASWPEIQLAYGFPFRWYELGLINGQRVDQFYGAEMDVLQHRLAENIGIALGTMFAIGLAVELCLGSSPRQRRRVDS